MFCKRCGKEIPSDSNVCQYCGVQVTPKAPVNTHTNFNNPTMNNFYQAPSAPQKKKTPWKIIAPIVAVLLIVAIVFGIFACANNKKKAVEDKLRQILKESTTKPVVEFMCEDYDGDGTYEAYAVVGESEEKEEYVEYYDADICYVNETEAEVIKESVRGHANGTIKVGNTIYVSLEVYDDNAEIGKSFVYTSENNESVESDISGLYANVHEEDGKIIGTDNDNNEIEISIREDDVVAEKNYTTKKQSYDVNEMYKEIIDKYKNIVYEVSIGNMNACAFGPYYITKDNSLKYAFGDLNNDSVPEMVIGIEVNDKIHVLEIWKYENETAVELFEDQIIGKRMAFEICQNGCFKLLTHSRDGRSVYTFYKYDKTSSAPYVVGSIGEYLITEGLSDVRYVKSKDELFPYEITPGATDITKEEYESILNQYEPISGLKWHTF